MIYVDYLASFHALLLLFPSGELLRACTLEPESSPWDRLQPEALSQHFYQQSHRWQCFALFSEKFRNVLQSHSAAVSSLIDISPRCSVYVSHKQPA